MDNKVKVLKYFIVPLFALTFIFLLGCQDVSAKATLNTISINMDKLANDLNKIETLETVTLIIDDFMDENNIEKIDVNNNTVEKNESLNNYIYKLSLLNNSIYDTVQTNQNIITTKRQIIAKAHQIKSLSDQCINDGCKIDGKNLDTLEELSSTVMTNTNRAYLGRNEVKNNLEDVERIKDVYSAHSDKLVARYEKLNGSLNTRLSYFNNILNGLDSIEYIITLNSECQNCNNADEQEYRIKENVNDSIKTSTGDIQTKKNWIKKNIDSYENAGIDFNQITRNPIYNQDNYLYGYGIYPNFNRNGYGMGYGGMYGYAPYGMPYGYGMPYTFPNINSFGSYKNIDTFGKPRMYKEKQENIMDENEKQDNIDDIIKTQVDADNDLKKPNKPMPKPLIPKKGETNLPGQDVEINDDKDVIAPPIQRPYIPKFEPKQAAKDIVDKSIYDLKNDNEDKFVNGLPQKPKIERLEENI